GALRPDECRAPGVGDPFALLLLRGRLEVAELPRLFPDTNEARLGRPVDLADGLDQLGVALDDLLAGPESVLGASVVPSERLQLLPVAGPQARRELLVVALQRLERPVRD